MIKKCIEFTNKTWLFIKKISQNKILGFICLIWTLSTFSLAHILNVQDMILTHEKSNMLFSQIEAELSQEARNLDDYAALSEFENQKNSAGFICDKNSGVNFGYTCHNHFIIEFIISYVPYMLTALIFGGISSIILTGLPLFLIGLIMTTPYIITVLFIKGLFGKKYRNA